MKNNTVEFRTYIIDIIIILPIIIISIVAALEPTAVPGDAAAVMVPWLLLTVCVIVIIIGIIAGIIIGMKNAARTNKGKISKTKTIISLFIKLKLCHRNVRFARIFITSPCCDFCRT